MWIPKIDGRQYELFEQWLPYWEWEERAFNMWGDVADKKTWLQRAIDFTGDHELYGAWMRKVVDEFPRACLHNLSQRGDKRSWIGHAAVARAIQCPEYIVRQAWGMLTDEQRLLANEQAARAILYWNEQHAKELFRV